MDGLASSLAYDLEHHWAFDPITTKKSGAGFNRWPDRVRMPDARYGRYGIGDARTFTPV
jgi:hypothetical protein